ncbi:MAG: SDR family oxidoreductase [Novosphingobium sp.]|nr:SDR family oxidoreductase [Novosphingobium sp.]
MDLGIAGKVAIVTGATANIGRGIALELAAEGARVIAVGRDPVAGARTVALAEERGAPDARFVAADLTDPDSAARICNAAEALGPVEILVNGLGGNVDQGLFVGSDPALWAGDIDLNFGTVLRMTHAVLTGMVERKSGAIVNVGSTAGLVGDYMLPVYSAMKGAVHAFTRALAKEVGQHGIRVNAIAPYATFAREPEAFSAGSRFHPDNAFFAEHSASLSDDDRAMRMRRTVVGRPFAVPEELSGLVAFLASPRASFITGEIYSINGGALL